MNSFVVIGLGLFGSSVARQLCQLGAEVLAIDVHPELVQQISSDVTNAVVADARDADILRALGAHECECAVVAIGDDLAGSVLATMNLKELASSTSSARPMTRYTERSSKSWARTRWSSPKKRWRTSWPGA